LIRAAIEPFPTAGDPGSSGSQEVEADEPAKAVVSVSNTECSWIMTIIHHAKYDAGQRVASRTGASEFAVCARRTPHAATPLMWK
jgi:hypothetical protein